jgi:hypothetical protein
MAPLHGGSSAGKSDLCCGHSLDVVGRPGLHQSGLMSICFAGYLSPGPRKNDLTIYWALGPFVRSFTLLVDPGDIYPPQSSSSRSHNWCLSPTLLSPSLARRCYCRPSWVSAAVRHMHGDGVLVAAVGIVHGVCLLLVACVSEWRLKSHTGRACALRQQSTDERRRQLSR